MAASHFARNASARKPTTNASEASHVTGVRHARRSPTPHLTREQYFRLLAFIEDQGGIVTIDQISRFMPQVAQPVSAAFDLCDAGILNVDWESAFDGDMHVWRVDR